MRDAKRLNLGDNQLPRGKLERLLDFADTDGTLVRVGYVFFDKQLSEKCDLPEPRPPYAPL